MYILTHLIGSLPAIIIFISCIIYVKKTKSLEGFLLFIGQFIIIIGIIFPIAILLSKFNNYPRMIVKYSTILWIISFLGILIFAIGFSILIREILKNKIANNEKVKNF